MGFFLRPKDTLKDTKNGGFVADTVELADGAQDEYTTRHPSEAREARKSAPLPSGNWRGGGTRTGKVGRK